MGRNESRDLVYYISRGIGTAKPDDDTRPASCCRSFKHHATTRYCTVAAAAHADDTHRLQASMCMPSHGHARWAEHSSRELWLWLQSQEHVGAVACAVERARLQAEHTDSVLW